MVYTPMVQKAMTLAYNGHHGQLDKGNYPYIAHVFAVAERMEDEITTVVALLHDLVEDTNYTIEDLIREGFPNEVIEALKLLTHNPELSYGAYIEKLSKNEIATKVKIADLANNSDLNRLNREIIDEDRLRFEKYNKYYFYLLDKLNKE